MRPRSCRKSSTRDRRLCSVSWRSRRLKNCVRSDTSATKRRIASGCCNMKSKSASLFTVHTSHSVAAVTDTGIRFSDPNKKAEAKSIGALSTSIDRSRPSCTISVLAFPAVSRSAERHSAPWAMMHSPGAKCSKRWGVAANHARNSSRGVWAKIKSWSRSFMEQRMERDEKSEGAVAVDDVLR